MIKNQYLTTNEAAKLLGFNISHVRRLIKQGHIKAEKVGKDWIIVPNDVLHIKRRRKIRTNEDGSSK